MHILLYIMVEYVKMKLYVLFECLCVCIYVCVRERERDCVFACWYVVVCSIFKINVSIDQPFFFFFQVAGRQTDTSAANTPQLLPRSLVNSWELEESQGARGGFAAHFLPPLPSDSSGADTHPLLSDILPGGERPGLPLLLFLSHRHLWVLKIDFGELTARARKSPEVCHSSWSRLVRVPLGSVVVPPGQSTSHIGDGDGSSQCADPRHHRRYLLSNKIWLLIGSRYSSVVEPLKLTLILILRPRPISSTSVLLLVNSMMDLLNEKTTLISILRSGVATLWSCCWLARDSCCSSLWPWTAARSCGSWTSAEPPWKV